MLNNKIIFFTKIPEVGYGKTRLQPFLSNIQRYELCMYLIKDNLNIISNSEIEVVIYFSGNEKLLDEFNFEKKVQFGDDLGTRMLNAITEELKYSDKVILLGSDLRGLDSDIIKNAFDMLDDNDIVLAPAKDGGYGIVGMKSHIDIFSGVTFSTTDVFNDTIEIIKNKGKKVGILKTVRDIDTLYDLVREELQTQDVSLIGSGEYNINFRFDKSYVFRINLGSQLNLGNKQIEYEYNALKILEDTLVTPKVHSYKLDGTYVRKAYLIMDFLDGRELNYDTDMNIAAKLLSTIHNHKIPEKNTLITANKPFVAMMDECKNMYDVYKNYENKSCITEKYIDKFIEIANSLGIDEDIENPCIINTELNNRNFIIGDKSYVIDWEKPIIGEAEQDIAHFLVPTTTNWKTDKILSDEEIENFIIEYEKYRKINRKNLKKYIIFNILRGVTWCSMAKVEYEKNEKGITNKDTYEKINLFLSEDYLKMLYSRFYEVINEK